MNKKIAFIIFNVVAFIVFLVMIFNGNGEVGPYSTWSNQNFDLDYSGVILKSAGYLGILIQFYVINKKLSE
jgi:hypothetical protein